MTRISVVAYGPGLMPIVKYLNTTNEDFSDWATTLKLEGYDTFKLRRTYA